MAPEDSQCPEIFYPDWQDEYEAALLEPEPDELFARIQAAETAMYARLQQISQNPDHYTERKFIDDALAALRVLKRDELGIPEWVKKAG